MKGIFVSTLVAAAAASKTVVPTHDYEFKHFVEDFERDHVPGTANWAEREAVFLKNRMMVLQQNTMHAIGRSSWHASLNEYGDQTEEELSKLRGYKPTMNKHFNDGHNDALIAAHLRRARSVAVEDLPASVDWRDHGVVTPPKDQGGCGSCWAFASTETLESHAAINSGKLLELAPQQYVNCVKNIHNCGGTGGCQGATAEVAYNYTAGAGLPLEADVPYRAVDGFCDASVPPAATVTGYHKLQENDADDLMQTIANVGPVAISAAAGTWMFYDGGVFDGLNGNGCDIDVDHAIQLVGYGTDGASGKDYWIVRNSWGPSWGEEGYIRIQRNPGNEPCQVDDTPEHGVCGDGPCACADTVTYCGTCGILADSVVPLHAATV